MHVAKWIPCHTIGKDVVKVASGGGGAVVGRGRSGGAGA